jgi:hypothetical protein
VVAKVYALLACQMLYFPLANLLLEEEETLLNNEDRLSHHSGGSNKGNTAKREVLSILEVLWKPEYNRAIIAVVAVMLAQQLCGMGLTLQQLLQPSFLLDSPANQLPCANVMFIQVSTA